MQRNGESFRASRHSRSRTTLDKMLRKSHVEWKRGRYYIPADKLSEIMSEFNVREELKRVEPTMDEKQLGQYTERIYSEAKNVHAAILYATRGECGDEITRLLDEGITDVDLPLARTYGQSDGVQSQTPWKLGRKDHYNCYKPDHSSCGIETISEWSDEYIQDLDRDQWALLAPVFEFDLGNVQRYEFHDWTIMPFIEDEENNTRRCGGYSEVWKVKLHEAHQRVVPIKNFREPRLLAVKRLVARDPTEDRKDFEREFKMLSRLNKLGHPHLVKLLATYKLLGRYHFVFPYAPANLRTHWDYVDMPYWNNDTYLWFLAQIRGLVSALRAIHDFGTGDVRLSSQQGNERTAHFTGRPSTHLKVVRDEQVFGRHGDLKPENILWSDDGHGGVLEITDLGLGRFHQLESRSRVDPRTVNGSPTYTPPEISLEIDVSRAYDIWSIGCVFLGFVSWLLEGSKAMYNFSDFRMGSISEEDEIEDDTFYSIRRRTDQTKYAIVRDGVDQWIERLKSNPRCSPMVLDLIQIIQEEMIVVEVDRRITAAGKARAEGLDAKMQRILEKGRANTEYLLGKSPPASQRDMGIKKPWKLTHQPPPDLHGVQFQVDGRPVNGS